MDAQDWDARYAAADLVWGVAPNRFVEQELRDVAPGTVLDVACGEGRNALWLAGRGWQATGADFSAVAVERAQALAAEAGLTARTRFEVVDVVAGPLPPGPFDAVVVAYLQLPARRRRQAFGHAAAALRPGGRLVVVGHDRRNLTEGVGGPRDEDVLYTPGEVLADVDGLVDVERAETVTRPVEGEDRSALDVLVVATRRNP